MPFLPSLPTDALVKDVYPINAESFRHWVHVEEAIMRGPSAFTPGERELMAAYVSKLNSCSYCYSSHSEAATWLGVDRTMLEAVMIDIDSAPTDKRIKPIFRFLKKADGDTLQDGAIGCGFRLRRGLGRARAA